ncbi:hypothetical protein Patl1_00265 [Pistacia atlantica]|uniref:Uncharacterized protein n=1 Tax=Pistacia atlantica TaxID=434234 RepID=A0ACC1C9F3_9ROSI|nr:hypothetical protein Patl1_00265 [Pistacia atlantica]
MEGGKGTVCVTGGTGFVASWLIMKLLEHEHNRDLSFLRNLPGASEKLQILYADLGDPDSFDAAIEGCSGVLHVATPIDFEGREPEEVVTKRAINGTIGILKACLKAKTVKRVVYTSSASAVVFNEKNVDIMDETFWSDVDFIRKTMPIVGSYMISKTLTEKAALEFAEEHGLDLVTLIPSFIVGPFICPKFPGSVRVALAMVRGNKEEYSSLLNTSMVHVDDVARAHIFLLEHPGVKGRYICSSHTITIEQMSQLLSAKYPEYPIPTLDEVAEIRGYKIPGLSSKKLLDAGFEFKYGVIEMFDGAINCCKGKGFL